MRTERQIKRLREEWKASRKDNTFEPSGIKWN